MIAPVQRHELRVRDSGRHAATGFERDAGVVARVHHQRRHGHLGQQRSDIDLAGRLEHSHGHVPRHRHALQFIEPVGLLLGRIRHELGGEELAEGRIRLTPAHPHQRQQGFIFFLLSSAAGALLPAYREPAIQDEMRYALGMSHRIRDRDRASLRDSEQREPGDPGSVDHRLQIAHEDVERDLVDGTIRKAVAAGIIAGQHMVLRQLAIQTSPDRAFEVVFQMGHPVARLDHGRPPANRRVGELDPVARSAEMDLLLQVDRIRWRDAGTGIQRPDGEYVHRVRDVLEGARAERLVLRLERAVHLVEDLAGNTDAARLGDALEPCRNVDPVAVDPGFVVDHVTQIDADAEQHAAMLGNPVVARRHDGLDLDRALGRVDHARKLGQDAVAGGVDNTAAVADDQRQDHRLMSLQLTHRRSLVLPHQAAIAGDVCRKYGGEPAIYRGIIRRRSFRSSGSVAHGSAFGYWKCMLRRFGGRLDVGAGDQPGGLRPAAGNGCRCPRRSRILWAGRAAVPAPRGRRA